MTGQLLDLVTHLLLAVFATGQMVETIRHGELFATSRARLEADPKLDWLAHLIRCGFCFSHWAAMFLVAIVVLTSVVLSILTDDGAWYANTVVFVLRFPIYWLAVTRMSQLLNDLTHDKNRTPREKVTPMRLGSGLPGGLEVPEPS